MKSKIFVIILAGLLFATNAKSQDYINSVGVRLGLSQGITFKHFVTRTDAAEGILAMRWEGFNITGLYEKHMNAFDVDELYFYYGGGVHLGVWNGNVNPWFNDRSSHTVIGIDGVIGLEYVFSQIPFNVGLDWKPALNLIGYAGFWGDELALSVRFMF
jgi:hypothetical protein